MHRIWLSLAELHPGHHDDDTWFTVYQWFQSLVRIMPAARDLFLFFGPAKGLASVQLSNNYSTSAGLSVQLELGKARGSLLHLSQVGHS